MRVWPVSCEGCARWSNCQCRFQMEILGQDQQAPDTMLARQCEHHCMFWFLHAICASQRRWVQCHARQHGKNKWLETRHMQQLLFLASLKQVSEFVLTRYYVVLSEFTQLSFCGFIRCYIYVRCFFSCPNSNASTPQSDHGWSKFITVYLGCWRFMTVDDGWTRLMRVWHGMHLFDILFRVLACSCVRAIDFGRLCT